MAARPRTRGKQATPPSDLEVTVLESLRATPGVTVAGLKKHVPVSHKQFVTPVLIESLADRGKIFFVKKGKKLFAGEPLAEIDAKLPDDAAREPIEKSALKALVGEAAPGYEAVFDDWLKRALARCTLFEHPAKRNGKKLIGRAPAKAAAPPPDLEATVLESVRATPGVTVAELKEHAPVSHKKFVTPALIETLVGSGDIFLVKKGKSQILFPTEPFAEIDAKLPDDAAHDPIEKSALEALVAEAAPGYEAVFGDWLKRAVTERKLFEHAPAKSQRTKRIGRTPDISNNLKAVLKTLKTALAKLDAQGVPRERVAEALLEALELHKEHMLVVSNGKSRGSSSARKVPASARILFLSALQALANDNPRDALLSVRTLRSRTNMGKQEFDTIATALAREGVVSLHHHDHASALPEAERLQLIQDDRGTYFNGIAPRRGT